MRFSRFSHLLPSALLILGLTALPSAATEVVRYQVLKSFGSVTNDGTQPWSTLIQGKDGALYGETTQGGTNGSGTLFKLNLDGSGYQILHHFGDGAADGLRPQGGLTAASDGLLYGATSGGGSRGGGTIFKLQPDGGGYTVMRSLNVATDGAEPQVALIEASDHVLYGTTVSGPGANYGGTLFAINKDGTGFRILHRFGPFTSVDGLQPLGSVIEGTDGVLYGTTSTGGGGAVGSVFRVNKDGTGYQKLYGFGFGAGVINPFAGLLEGSDGGLYGTGGGGAGGVFRLNKDGSGYTVLHGFNDAWPFAALVKGRDGALYSTTAKDRGAGTVYRLNEDGSGYEVLHAFGTEGDGRAPETALVLANEGAFYGTTLSGGDLGRGTVFRLLVNRFPVPKCADMIVSADFRCVGNAFVDQGSFDPDGGTITLVQTPPGPYPIGTNRVTLTVTDSNGDSDACTAAVIVLDPTPPTITCPPNKAVDFVDASGAAVSFTVTSSGHCDPNPVVVSVPPSGSLFPIGTTEVHSTATDTSGNQASCVFTVTVRGARAVKEAVLGELVALRAATVCDQGGHRGGRGSGDSVCQLLDKAIKHLGASLTPPWWVDQTHLQRQYGQLVFGEEQATVVQLCSLIRHHPSAFPNTLLEGFIARIDRADQLVASVAIQDAIAAGAPSRRTEQALRSLSQGDADAQTNPCGSAITHYRQAWEYVVRPNPSRPTHLPEREAPERSHGVPRQ